MRDHLYRAHKMDRDAADALIRSKGQSEQIVRARATYTIGRKKSDVLNDSAADDDDSEAVDGDEDERESDAPDKKRKRKKQSTGRTSTKS